MPLPDPILEQLDAEDIASRRCRGWTKRGKRCARLAPDWWPTYTEFRCHIHR